MASTSSVSGPTLSIGGLATGMDTNSIVDKLVQLESIPLTRLQTQQSAFNTQISLLGDLASRLDDLQSAAASLGSGGVTALQTTSSNATSSATPGSGASPGSYSVEVTTLATAAKWRSAGVGAHPLQPGKLRITVDAKTYPPDDGTPPITIDGSTTLDSLAAAIRATGAPVSVSVLDNGSDKFLSITNLATGYTVSQDAALSVDFQATDPAAPDSALANSLAYTDPADNASFKVDDLTFSRTTNVVSDAIPGTTLTLKAKGGPETLTIGSDVAGTQANLQKFVDGYNGLMSAIQKQMTVDSTTNRASTLAGDTNVQGLQRALQSITSSIAVGQGTVRSLADLGVKTNRDGTLAIDGGLLSSAIARDPGAVNAVFAQATTGISRQLSTIATSYSSVTGLLSTEQTTLQQRVTAMGAQAAEMQARIDAYRQQLLAQFAAMEDAVSSFKSIGDYLTAQDNANKK